VTTVILIRHGLTDETGSVMSGWTPGVRLNERGRAQAAELAARLRGLALAAIVSSPLERCAETAAAILDGRATLAAAVPPSGDGSTAAAGVGPLAVQVDDRLGEVHYGEWTGRALRDLAREPLWEVVRTRPSEVEFPGGESLRAMQARAVGVIHDWNRRLGPEAVWLACSHGDPIRAIVADALGIPLDAFGRLAIGPASVTIIRYTDSGPFVLHVNGSGVDAARLAAQTEDRHDGTWRDPAAQRLPDLST
jgi:probable phosphomutase (TIGR03848 family)